LSQQSISLATVSTFAVLASTTVTSTGASVIVGDLGLNPGSEVTGFPPASLTGVAHVADGVSLQAQTDLTAAFLDAAGRVANAIVSTDLGGQTLQPGVYKSLSSMSLTGPVPLTLDGGGHPDAVFIFQAATTLTTGSASSVQLIGGASACNIFWQVGSSATLAGSAFEGTVLSLASITATTSAGVHGRLLARTGAVTLDTNAVTLPLCQPCS
jgi:type VI secretion system secreted protein VgrG